MNRLQKLQLRQSEVRVDLGKLLDIPEAERTDTYGDDRDKLTSEVRSLETDVGAAIAAGEDKVQEIATKDTSEGREYRQMLDKASLGSIFDDLLSHRNPSGVEAELQSHLGLQGNQVPLDMLRGGGRAGADGAWEERAVTPGATNVGQNQQNVISYVFPQSAAAFLGVSMPTVGVGEAVFPVLTSELTVGTPAENAAQAETTGAFSSVVLSPKRLQASFFYSREDRARFSGMDAALRLNLSAGLADGLDKEILSGTDGLFTGTNLANNAQTTNDTFDSYLSNLVWNQIDGRYAAMTSDLAMVVGTATYKDVGQTYRNTSVDRSALDRIMELVSGVRVSAHVPVPDTNRQNVVIRRGMSETAVAPVWEGITLIPDEITKAAHGQIVITAIMLFAMKVLRKNGGLVKQGTDHS